MKNKSIVFLFLIGSFLFAATLKKEEVAKVLETVFSEVTKNEKEKTSVVETKENLAIKSFSADIGEGVIGIAKTNEVDNAYDNVFHISVANLPAPNESAYLEYELYGYETAASVSRSLNNQASVGGQFLTPNSNWSEQSEVLSEQLIRKGDNVLLFTAPEGINNSYRIKNVRIVYKSTQITPSYTLLKSQDKLYIKGITTPSQYDKLKIEGHSIDLTQAEFELILDVKNLKNKKSITIAKEAKSGEVVYEKIELKQFTKAASYRKIENASAVVYKSIDVQKINTLSYADFSAVFPVGVLQNNLTISASGLRKIDIAPLNSAMVNVTATKAGFRLLPHGTVFEKAATLSLPFDKKAIPEGYTEKDINVFYFDENKRSWLEVSKDSLDLKKGIITAKTTHFTDFIAGIIKMPESPETSGYTPTSIKDLKAASPLVGIQSIAPPSANGRGTASTGFSIAIPKGRGGMQPSFNLQYDSDGGHSWAGMGWDVSAPAVSIETRWGAPRYDINQETESYSIAGEALIPNAHRDTWVGRIKADKQFYPRREGAFQQIIRKGDSPNNYYWVVKDKSGVTSYYGGNTSGLASNAILQDASGNIGHWALCFQVDLKGNSVSYEYDKREGELYLKNVYYTGFGTTKGNYSVSFIKNSDLGETNRSDVQVSARLGFRQMNDQLLRKIEVRYKDQMIRSYELKYTEGAFKKTLLKSISEFDSQSKLFYTNTLDYFDDVRDSAGNYEPFGEEQAWTVPDNHVKQGFTGIDEFESNHTLVGSTIGDSKGINYRIAIGPPDSNSYKNNTIGAHGGNNWGKSETFVVLQDLDGDGYPDKIFSEDNVVSYCKNLMATVPFTFDKPKIITGINNLGISKTKSFSWGVDGSIGNGVTSANIGYDEQRSRNQSTSYFMDFNGDGLPDFVNKGKVQYNRIVNGVPTFLSSSIDTPSPVSGKGTLVLSMPDRTAELNELLDKNPLQDVVRVWQAPVTGTVLINQSYQLIKDTSPDRQAYNTRNEIDKADGVHLYFQKNSSLIWDEIIIASDTNLKTRPAQTLPVTKGERLYFRVSSIKDGNYDKVIWDPKIEYIKAIDYYNENNVVKNRLLDVNNSTDANLISLKNFEASSDFFVSQANPIVVPTPGLIQFSGSFKKPITSDHVTLKITKKVIGSAIETLLFEREFLASDIIDFDMGTLNFTTSEENTLITTSLSSLTNIDVKSLFFDATLTVPPSLGTELSDDIKKVDIGHSFYSKINGNYLINGLVPTLTGKLNMFINPNDYNLAQSLINSIDYKGNIIITAKQNGILIARNNYKVQNGVLSAAISGLDTNYIFPNAVKDLPIDLEIYVSNPMLNDIIKSYPSGSFKINYRIENTDKEELTYPNPWIGMTDNFSVFSDLDENAINFGLQYKNWGRFTINGNLAGKEIDQAQLKFNSNNNIDPDNIPDVNTLDPDAMPEEFNTNNQYFIPMTARYANSILYGGEEAIFIQNEFMGTSRLGEDDFAEYIDFSSPITTISQGETEALDMITESKSRSIGGGGGVGGDSGGVSGGISASDGNSYVVQTMSDMNGDRYPDYIRDGNVQFTTPIGGKDTLQQNVGNFSHSETISLGGSASGSYCHSGTNNSASIDIGKAGVKFNSAKTNAGGGAAKAGGSVSLGGNIGFSKDHSVQIYSDINGDGLADKIEDNETVSLNTGYSFLPSENWPNMNVINKGKSLDIAGNAGYSIYNGSFSGGLNYSHTTSDNSNSFLDINSDGLGDKIKYNNHDVSVELNLGNSFAPAITYPRYESMTRNTSSSLGGSIGFSIPITLVYLKIVPSFGASIGTSTSRTEATFMDMDGDGNLDYILSEDENHLVVRLSNIKRTNKLKGVTNAAGNSYVVDYELVKPTYENPNAKWVLQSVDVFDGHVGDGIDHSIAKFKYENGFYDRRERDFYGFAKVTQEQIDAADNSVFATTVQEFYNQDYFRKNLLFHSYTLDKNNKMRQESTNEYSFVDVVTQVAVPVASLGTAVCDARRIFVGLIQANQKMYEGGSEFLETNTYNTYDDKGNITYYEDLGNGTADDKVTAKISYYESVTPYFGGIPKQLEVFTKDGLRRKRATTINPTTAEVTQIKNYAAANEIAVTDIAYDSYGNLQKITGPANYKAQRMTLEYVYDADNNQFMTEIKDAFGYQNKMEYDYRFGIPLKTTDRNDQSTIYTIDAVGRPKTIQGPYEIASGKAYTIAYDYFPFAKVPYAKTRNYDPELDKDIETYTYTDGLGRALQVKKTASLFTQAGSPDQEAHIVSGKVVYDGLGRPIESYYPTTTTTMNADFSIAVSNVTPTTTEYDEVGRAVRVTLPDGSSNTTTFKIDEFEGVPTMLTTQTDALNNSVQSQTDVKGSNLASIQNNLVTKFEINALGETVQVTDAMDHITKSTYDWLGRRTEFTHPDAGTTTMEYDLAGNLTKRITQDIKNTTPNGGAIQYEYDYNRLETIKYPKNPQNNVQYNYGKADGTASRRGRLWFVQDASGGQEFFYGKLGEVEKEIRTLRITPTDVQTYISQFEYDTWNRIQKMTYPDGEVVDYTYNRAGNLQSMHGKKESHTYDYIKQLAYDEFEQRKYLKYGNDTETNYTYDPTMRRLQQLQVKSGSRQVMNNSYGYDLVGNVLNIKNSAPIVNNTLGGTSNHEYQYDEFYRLKNAKALYNGEFTKSSYELNMSYNTMHNITKKDLVHTVNNEQKGYVLDYNYDNEAHPNAPSSIQETIPTTNNQQPRTYIYDGNGNPTSYSENQSFRKMTWDEENRLMGINDNGRIHQYTYDAGGERVIKSSGDSQHIAVNGQTAATIVHTDDYTGYVSPYFVISKGKFTKHYFEGAGRIVSKLGNGSFAQPLKLTAGGVNYSQRTAEEQKAMDAYVKTLGVPPGPATQQGIYATPEFTGDPYPSDAPKPVEENQEPPEGWPRNPVFNKAGDVPGPPVQFGPPVQPTTVAAGEGFTGIGLPENDIFYFHPDHLGSTSYITTKNGSISQHVEYIAFGEILFEEHSSSFSSPYLFNGKELDRETNLSYYGARYLDMKTSLWLNVDPLAEKYSNFGAYVYCANNPINLLDPDGRKIVNADRLRLAKVKSQYDSYMASEKYQKYSSLSRSQAKKIYGKEGIKERKNLINTVNAYEKKISLYESRADKTDEIMKKWQSESPNIYKKIDEMSIDLYLGVDQNVSSGNSGEPFGGTSAPKMINGNYCYEVVEGNGLESYNALSVFISSKVNISSPDVETEEYSLNHEGGHFIFAVENPEQYFKDLGNIPKDEYNGGHHPNATTGKEARGYGLIKDIE